MIDPPIVLSKELDEGKGRDAQEKRHGVLGAAVPRVFDDMEYKFVCSALSGSDDTVVC